jgi:MFS family permease
MAKVKEELAGNVELDLQIPITKSGNRALFHFPFSAKKRLLNPVKASSISVGAMFFIHGLCFSSWASRIPSIQEHLQLSSSELGAVLFTLPAGFFISLPAAGWLVTKLGSKKVGIASGVLYSLALVAIGSSNSSILLTLCLFAFGFFGNLLNISINTQAIAVEKSTKKALMGSFHGMWSVAGFAGAAFGSFMIAVDASPFIHFVLIDIVFLTTIFLSAYALVDNDVKVNEKRPIFSLPDSTLLGLGMIAFCSMLVEGAMFDWSGIYFLKVVTVRNELIGIGYTAFMVAMACMRFTADRLSSRFGLKRMLQGSGVITASGLLLAVSFPLFWTALLGFFLIGAGVSSVVPLVFSKVGKSKTMSPGAALAATSSLGFMGLLLGPPAIGFIAELTSLRIAFLTITIMALGVVTLSSLLKAEQSDA